MNWLRPGKKASIYTRELVQHPCVTVGEHTYGKPHIHSWDDKTHLTIGKFCSIADNVHFFLGGNHRMDWVSTYPFNALHEHFPAAAAIAGHPATRGDIHVGNDVWIADGVSILSGVTIGNGAVLGASCIVRRNVGPYEIVLGNPMQGVKKRFTDEQIRALEAIAWWHWDDQKINDNVSLLCATDIQAFIDKHKPQTL